MCCVHECVCACVCCGGSRQISTLCSLLASVDMSRPSSRPSVAPSLRRPAPPGPDSRLSARSRSRERAARGDARLGLGGFEDADYLHERFSRQVAEWGRHPGCALRVCVCVSVCVCLCVCVWAVCCRCRRAPSPLERVQDFSIFADGGHCFRTSRRMSVSGTHRLGAVCFVGDA